MQATITRAVLAATLAIPFAACTANIHDNQLDVDAEFNIDEATVDLDSDDDLDNVQAGNTVNVSIDATNVFLVEPSATPPPQQIENAGHFVFYLDDFSGAQLLVTAQTNVRLTIPAGTPEGPHKVKCRVHKHDGTPTNATFELDITVKASVTIGGQPDAGSGSGADASNGT